MVAIFTPQLLDEIGDAVAGLRPSICAIHRSTAVDSQGVPTGASPSTVVAVGCRVDVPGRVAIEAQFGPRLATAADAIISVPRGTAVTTTDQIVVTIEGVATTFEVIDVPVASHFAEIPVLCSRSR